MREREGLTASPPSSAPSAAESFLPPPPRPEFASELDLAHELGEVIRALLRVGTLLACSGAAAFRVRDAMQRTAVALGATRSEFMVTVDAITASVFAGGEFRTQIVRLPPVGVDMNLLCRIEMLTREWVAHPTPHRPEEVHKRLNELQRAQRVYPAWLSVLSLGAACAAFSSAGQRPSMSIVCAFVGAALGHSLRLSMLARKLPLVSIVVSCAFVSCTAAELSAWPLSLLSEAFGGASVKSGVATVASVLYLIPGVPLVNSLIDLIHLDLSAGLSRAAYAAVLTGSIAIGVFGFFAIAGLFG